MPVRTGAPSGPGRVPEEKNQGGRVEQPAPEPPLPPLGQVRPDTQKEGGVKESKREVERPPEGNGHPEHSREDDGSVTENHRKNETEKKGMEYGIVAQARHRWAVSECEETRRRKPEIPAQKA